MSYENASRRLICQEKTEAVKGIFKILRTRIKIGSFLKNDYNYSLNNNFKKARKEYSKVLEYEQNKTFKRQ